MSSGGTSTLKWENIGEGETNFGGASPLKRENIGEGEMNSGGTSPLKRENAGEGETNAVCAARRAEIYFSLRRILKIPKAYCISKTNS